MRSAIQIGNALVRSGYVGHEEMAAALALIAEGDFSGANVIVADSARLRRAKVRAKRRRVR